MKDSLWVFNSKEECFLFVCSVFCLFVLNKMQKYAFKLFETSEQDVISTVRDDNFKMQC